MKRNSFVYIFKTTQITIMSLITMSVFFRTTMHHKTMADGSKFYERFSVLPFVGLCAAYLGTKDSTITHGILDIDLPNLLYHWICSRAILVLLPILGVFWPIHQMTLSLFRTIGAIGRTVMVANIIGIFSLRLVFVLGGFIIDRGYV